MIVRYGKMSLMPQHTPLGVSFRGKKKDFVQKRWNSREKEGMGGVCAASFWQVHV
jgi:hypothetical protein